jgi:hypothetical protein
VYWALLAAVREAMDRKYTQRMEVFFDVHDKFQAGISQTYKKFYDDMAPPDWRQVMPYHPSFRDDEEFVILQAADLLAGQDRLSFENNPNNPEWVATLCKKLTVSKYYMFFDANKLNAMSHDIKFREVIEAFSDDESSASADSYGD